MCMWTENGEWVEENGCDGCGQCAPYDEGGPSDEDGN